MPGDKSLRLLEGDRALVTGAASGIGRAIARALAREGATVVASDAETARGEGLVRELRREGLAAHFVAADLASETGAAELLKKARAVVGDLSVFVHSASPPRRESDIALAVDRATWDAMLEVNLAAGFFLGREIGRAMREQKIRGRMLFVTSLHATTPRNLPHYSAAKAGMTMVMKELARALGPAGIRVNALAPGAVPGGGFSGDFRALAAKIPMRRVGNPDEVAQAAVALLCERFSAYVTGTTVAVDGGLALYSWIEPSAE